MLTLFRVLKEWFFEDVPKVIYLKSDVQPKLAKPLSKCFLESTGTVFYKYMNNTNLMGLPFVRSQDMIDEFEKMDVFVSVIIRTPDQYGIDPFKPKQYVVYKRKPTEAESARQNVAKKHYRTREQ